MLIHAEIMAQNRNPRWRPSSILDFRKSDFWALRPLGLPIFYHCTKFGAKLLIDAKIMAENRNPRWRPSAILDFPKLYFWALDALGLPIFHLGIKFGAKMFIEAEIMSQHRNPRWRPSDILDLLHHQIGPVFSLGQIGLSNFMLIRCIVLEIWRFDFLQIRLEMPIHAPKIWVFGVWTPKRHWSSSRPEKAHPWPKPHFLRANFRADRSTGATCTRAEKIEKEKFY